MSRFKHIIDQEPSQQPQQELPPDWPKVFPKSIVGLDRDGVINVNRDHYITDPDDFEVYPESLAAIHKLRIKGYKVVILTNQGGIIKGLQTHAQVEAIHQRMFEIFGNAGIYSIDGLYYSESSLKEDYYAKPNIGMFHRVEKELFDGKARFKDKGFYVGDKMSDLKAAERIGATPILVRTGHGVSTERELSKFSKEKLRKKTKVFDNLLQFVEKLP
jgi:D-glycero-D-manno-heptose 1,7-bisphosphate phosphatase